MSKDGIHRSLGSFVKELWGILETSPVTVAEKCHEKNAERVPHSALNIEWVAWSTLGLDLELPRYPIHISWTILIFLNGSASYIPYIFQTLPYFDQSLDLTSQERFSRRKEAFTLLEDSTRDW